MLKYCRFYREYNKECMCEKVNYIRCKYKIDEQEACPHCNKEPNVASCQYGHNAGYSMTGVRGKSAKSIGENDSSVLHNSILEDLGLYNKGFMGLCHFTDISNLKNIFKYSFIYSRDYVRKYGLLNLDAADHNVLNNTKSKVFEYVRMYFRYKTPTNYKNEGIYGLGNINIEHEMPIPVLLIVDENIINHKGVKITSGNAASNLYSNLYDYNDLKNSSIDWNEVFSKGIPNNYYEKKHRCAEVLYPNKLSVIYIKKILFRTNAEKKLAEKLCGNNSLYCVDSNKFYVGEKEEINCVSDYKVEYKSGEWIITVLLYRKLTKYYKCNAYIYTNNKKDMITYRNIDNQKLVYNIRVENIKFEFYLNNHLCIMEELNCDKIC